jgi:hypothetical protein
MKIKEENRKMLINDIKFIIDRMEKEKETEQKLYYFTGIYGTIARIFNIEFDPELVFAHIILSMTYGNIKSRIDEREKVIKLPPELFDKLISTTKEFLEKIEKNENLCDVLKKYAVIAYLTTGNGYYLYQKGLLTL